MNDVPERDAAQNEEDRARANVYRLLGTLLARPPDEEVLALLRQIESDEEGQPGGMAAAWASLKLAASRLDPVAVNDEYHSLFIGVGRGEVVPYGSWYLTGFMMDRPLARLRQDLQDLGLERADDVSEPEDHAGALCESMSLLVAGDARRPQIEQKQFFYNHLAPWMVKFFEDLQAASSADFYKAVGALGEEFLRLEKSYLDMLPH